MKNEDDIRKLISLTRQLMAKEAQASTSPEPSDGDEAAFLEMAFLAKVKTSHLIGKPMTTQYDNQIACGKEVYERIKKSLISETSHRMSGKA